ncbi:unnamed protein product [Lepeophtheirus salmonis]|uniref:(salmon louse) hypothetical protein n=1 Tax=Lepeophtheirus salmonis TaxID=72036 RepID=A0A7R8CDM5_LEPSM|nr:unnamed protein product [Lepeophtheirus salmonis]CAF2776137.1 unnamed protein product [Lepeophtheirus salmonis]
MHRGPSGTSRRPFVGHESLEDDNSSLELDLKKKVDALKSISINIGAEAREHYRLLQAADDEMDSTNSLLSSTSNHVMKILGISRRHSYYFIYLVLFILFITFILWLKIR